MACDVISTGEEFDEFKYAAVDKAGSISNIATVRISLKSALVQNTPPTALDIDITAAEDTSIIGFFNASDIESPAKITFTLQNLTSHGELTLLNSEKGMFKYTPSPQFEGIDNFTYSAEVINSEPASHSLFTVDITIKCLERLNMTSCHT